MESVGRGLGLISSGDWGSHLDLLRNSVASDSSVELFLSGLVEGVVSTPGSANQCTTEIYTWVNLLGMLSTLDFSSMTVAEILSVGCSVYSEFTTDLMTACNIPQLLNLLHDVTVYTLLVNYVDNGCEVNAAIKAVKECGKNYYACGYSVGAVVRLELGWVV